MHFFFWSTVQGSCQWLIGVYDFKTSQHDSTDKWFKFLWNWTTWCVTPRAQKVINLLSITSFTHCRIPKHFSFKQSIFMHFFSGAPFRRVANDLLGYMISKHYSTTLLINALNFYQTGLRDECVPESLDRKGFMKDNSTLCLSHHINTNWKACVIFARSFFLSWRWGLMLWTDRNT